MSLCPICNERPRRRAGGYCLPCTVVDNRARRRGTPTAPRERAPHEPTRLDLDLGGVTRFLITSAQNATPAHKPFLRVLEAYARETRAALVVVPLRYKNPTSVWAAREQEDDWWDPAVTPYLCNVRKRLGKHLVLLADVKVQPTAASPLTGFESLTGTESAILGHPRMQFRSVAAPTGRLPKILSTTGSVTQRNATDTRAGKVADFHHFLGGIVVELEAGGSRFHLRQVNAHRETGEFTDLDRHWTAKGSRRAPPALALVLGDIHAGSVDPEVDRATFGKGGIVETLDPGTVVFHDLLDGLAVNPHESADPFVRAARRGRADDVRAEVEAAVQFAVQRLGKRRGIVVPSNHNDFLRRWLVATDWRSDPANAAFYLETAAHMVGSARMGMGGPEYADPFRYWVERLRGRADLRCLARGESFSLAGVEMGAHGNEGPNGARGSLRNLSRLGSRITTGHSHSPGIEAGHYQCGTSTRLRLGYNAGGPSSWLHTHTVEYATGKRALLSIIDGHWRARY